MESKWGRNVMAVGLGGAGCTLAARILTLPGEIWLTNGPRLGAQTLVWHRVPDTANVGGLVPFQFPCLTDTFPFGWPVLPNEPL